MYQLKIDAGTIGVIFFAILSLLGIVILFLLDQVIISTILSQFFLPTLIFGHIFLLKIRKKSEKNALDSALIILSLIVGYFILIIILGLIIGIYLQLPGHKIF